MSSSPPAVPIPVFTESNLFIAAILFALYRKELPYLCCRYHFDVDEYRFWFRDEQRIGTRLAAKIRSSKDAMVSAAAFREGMTRLHREFQEQQRANGNPQSGGGQR